MKSLLENDRGSFAAQNANCFNTHGCTWSIICEQVCIGKHDALVKLLKSKARGRTPSTSDYIHSHVFYLHIFIVFASTHPPTSLSKAPTFV